MATPSQFPKSSRNPLIYDMGIRGEGPKGGSPKTPLPVALSALEPESKQWLLENTNGDVSGIWKAVSTGLGGLLVGMTVAWFTALWQHGVSDKDMREYVKSNQYEQEKQMLTRNELHEYVQQYSPWNFDKQAIINRLSTQDQEIGGLRIKIDMAAKIYDDQRNQIKK